MLETEPTVESEFDGGPVQIITSLVARRAQVATATRSGAPWPVLTPSVHQNLVGVVKKFEANVNAISVLRELEANNTPPDADQRAALNQYTGWGGIKQPFDVCVHPDWVERALKLKSLLSEDEFESAKGSTLNAHLAPIAPLIGKMWSLVRKLGFTGGRVLEPSSGLRLLPWRDARRYCDSVTGNSR